MEGAVLHGIRPILYTDRLEESVQFYRDVLGFELNEYNADWGWASLGCGMVEIMLSRPVGNKPFDGSKFTGSLYITCEAVEVIWMELKDQLEVVYSLEEFPWRMREFAVYDLNGYVIQFGEMVN